MKVRKQVILKDDVFHSPDRVLFEYSMTKKDFTKVLSLTEEVKDHIRENFASLELVFDKRGRLSLCCGVLFLKGRKSDSFFGYIKDCSFSLNVRKDYPLDKEGIEEEELLDGLRLFLKKAHYVVSYKTSSYLDFFREKLGFGFYYVDFLPFLMKSYPDRESYALPSFEEDLGLVRDKRNPCSKMENLGDLVLSLLDGKEIGKKEGKTEVIIEEKKTKPVEKKEVVPEVEEKKEMVKTEEKDMKKNPGSMKKPILQLDDEGNLIHEFESVAKASEVTLINEKSIRDAAKGRQKHAGGYVWKYKE